MSTPDSQSALDLATFDPRRSGVKRNHARFGGWRTGKRLIALEPPNADYEAIQSPLEPGVHAREESWPI